MPTLQDSYAAIVSGEHRDVFAVLGAHRSARTWAVRTFQPQAEAVDLTDEQGQPLASMRRVHAGGVFEARRPLPVQRYRLRLHEGGHTRLIEDPYCFDSPLGDLDNYLLGEGTHLRLYDKLGAHPMRLAGVRGVHFSVWAPNARRVSVVGPFNAWDGRRHPLRLHPGSGVWDIFVPGLGVGELYKFELKGPDGALLPLKADPFARRMEPPPGNASIVHQDDYAWGDGGWMQGRAARTALDRPVAIYEVHLGSWRRHSDGNRWPSYRELAAELVPYAADMGYTHLELLPPTEHPFDGSWGYQPIGLFAPTWRFGPPEDFKHLVDRCHQQGLGVIIDWVPAHFPRDAHGIGRFDGTHLYEHADPRRGAHPDWGTLIFNFARPEVVNYLLASALFWLEHYHVDALRVDAVASMLYLDYSRKPGEWLPNPFGGKENLEAVAFLRRMNEVVHSHGGLTMAEESTAWPMVSRPTYTGGLGFTYKWNLGWMHDSLEYFGKNPVHRRWHHDKLTFGLLYAFSENFILPLSHDEVVHGKGSLLARMPGDSWQRLATLRLYYTFMYGHPGKKLMFMGAELAQRREWNHDRALDWGLCAEPGHAGVQRLVRDLNLLYRRLPALHQVDFDPRGFEWLVVNDAAHSVFAFLRRAEDPQDFVLVVCNCTPLVRRGYRVGVPDPGHYRELINSDATEYGGSGVGNLGGVSAHAVPAGGQACSLTLTLPPLAGLVLQPERSPPEP